jgi:glutaredoxin-related protein
MEKPSLPLIMAIRSAAVKLESSTIYQWGHMGACNCGFLAQEVTKLTKEEIHARAMMRHGDWTEQLNDYCKWIAVGRCYFRTVSLWV